MQYLNTVDTQADQAPQPFRLPVQWVNRPNLDFRGFCGRVAAGSLRPGDAVRVLPSGVQTRIKAVLLGFDEVSAASAGDSITVTLTDEVDASRGDVLVAADAPPEVADQFEARLLWMSEHALAPGRQYLMKHACKEVTATITDLKYRQDVNTGEHLAAKKLTLNEIAVVNISTSAPLVFEPYATNQTLGGFILIDKLTFETVGAGMIDFALRRASNIHWQALEINKAARAAHNQQSPRCIWLTGLSGSGKSTIANCWRSVCTQKAATPTCSMVTTVRHGLNRDLGFTEADRVENIRRVAEVATVDGGRRPDCAGEFYLAVPGRTAHGA
jgi:bifunctional enzyme CysN/CysC